jgi:uncharacterized protein YndB with AHSA1/START domain
MDVFGNRGVASGRPVRVRREVVLPTDPERAWSAVTREMTAWFGAEVDIDLHPGGRVTFRWPDGWERGAVLEHVEAPRTLVFRWLPFERNLLGGMRPAGTGRVELLLEEAEGGTRLSVTELGHRLSMITGASA